MLTRSEQRKRRRPYEERIFAWPRGGGDAPHLILRATLDKICVTQGHQWLSAMRGDAAASIATAVAAMTIDQITLEVDLVMTILTICALDGSADATLALAHILYRVELHHPFAQELSLSWLVTNLRCACSVQKQPIAMRYGSNNSNAWTA